MGTKDKRDVIRKLFPLTPHEIKAGLSRLGMVDCSHGQGNRHNSKGNEGSGLTAYRQNVSEEITQDRNH